MEKQQKIQDLKLIVKENETRYVFDEESGKMEEMIVSTVAVKLRYGGEQYGEYVVCAKPTLEVSDVVDMANEIFVSLLSALDQPQEGDGMSNEKQQKILEMAKDICRYQPCCNDVCKPISACDALRYAERAVEAGYSKQEWISVDERLPEECKNVLCFTRNKTMIAFMEKVEDCGKYVPVFWDWVAYDRDDTYDEVCATHWMPLPEAPKGVKGTPKKTYYTPDEVRNMSMNEIRDNITVIRESMKRWRDE